MTQVFTGSLGPHSCLCHCSHLCLSLPPRPPLLPGIPSWALGSKDHKPGPDSGLTQWPASRGGPRPGSRAVGERGGSDPGPAPPPSLPAPPRSACTSCPTSPPWTSSTSSPNTSAAPRASRMRMVAAAPLRCGLARGASGGPESPSPSKLVGLGAHALRDACLQFWRKVAGRDGLLSPQPRALPLLLRQRDRDDEPCLQGEVPEGEAGQGAAAGKRGGRSPRSL